MTTEAVDTSVNESGAEEVVVDTAVEGEVTEPEMGRGCREKVPSVKLRDYVSYNARYLKEKSPPHDLDHTPAPTLQSEPSSTVSGSTPYPLENYISDERFHHLIRRS